MRGGPDGALAPKLSGNVPRSLVAGIFGTDEQRRLRDQDMCINNSAMEATSSEDM